MGWDAVSDPYEEWKRDNPPRPDDQWERFQHEARIYDKIREKSEGR